jgi:hypothetical protein
MPAGRNRSQLFKACITERDFGPLRVQVELGARAVAMMAATRYPEGLLKL